MAAVKRDVNVSEVDDKTEPKLAEGLFKADRRDPNRVYVTEDRRQFLRPTKELKSRGLLIALVVMLIIILACYTLRA